MARFTYIPNRVFDSNGIADGATIEAYLFDTTTKVSLFADEALTIPVQNPYTVYAGAAVPPLYYDDDLDVRFRVVSNEGEVIADDSPYIALARLVDFLEIQATLLAARDETLLARDEAVEAAEIAELAADLAQQASTAKIYKTWAALNAVTGTVGDTAVIYEDNGTHTDPVVGGTVSNTGFYMWSASPAGWERIASTEAIKAKFYADAAAASAASVGNLVVERPDVFNDITGEKFEIAFLNTAETHLYGTISTIAGVTAFRPEAIDLPAGSVTLSDLAPDVVSGITGQAKYVAELIPGGALYSNNTQTGARVLIEATGASDPVVVGDGIYYTVGGVRYWRIGDASAPAIPAFSSLAGLTTIGDSLTADSNGGLWRMAAELSVTGVNRGFGGESVNDIALHVGAIQPLVTVTGNQLPASGPVNVTAITPATGWTGFVPTSFSGTILGIPATMSKPAVGQRIITRTTPGSVVSIPAGTPFICTQTPLSAAENVITIEIGRNAVTSSFFETDTLAATAAIVAWARAKNRRIVVVGILNGRDEGIGTENYTKIVSCNSKLAALYPNEFFDVRRPFIDNGLTLAGITPTTQDTAAIALDKPPPSIMAVGAGEVHPSTPTGYNVYRYLVRTWMQSKGWFV